jgi:hypothetical protein
MKAFELAVRKVPTACHLIRRAIGVTMLALVLGSSAGSSAVYAQGVAPWLAAADPFEKLVKDIGEFAKYVVTEVETKHKEEVANAVPELVKAMIDVANEKRDLAKSIRDALENQSADQTPHSLGPEAKELLSGVRNLRDVIDKIDPNWVVKHTRLDQDFARLIYRKSECRV